MPHREQIKKKGPRTKFQSHTSNILILPARLSPEVGATNWGPIIQQMSLWRKFNIQNTAQLKYVLNHLIKIFFARTEAPVKAKSKDQIDILDDLGFSTIRK